MSKEAKTKLTECPACGEMLYISTKLFPPKDTSKDCTIPFECGACGCKAEIKWRGVVFCYLGNKGS